MLIPALRTADTGTEDPIGVVQFPVIVCPLPFSWFFTLL